MILFLLLIGAYMLGTVLTASIISKFFYKKNIQVEGSGNPGARNAGRVLGKKAFVATFIGDALKGAVAVLVARWLGFVAPVELLALFVVMLGHNYPLWLRFRGGMGVSTFIGGMLAFNPLLFAVFVGLFVVVYPFLKSFTVAGLSAVVCMPIIVLIFSYGMPTFLMACLVAGLLLFAHREDIKEKLHSRR
ncbi:glycerol-3-phosphate acyltransferase [Sporosarcina sp. YIM B06819]|uniref:glycerol-3-phosphate acyltransferase n=1 Tax=Sporosarcina sp. YIM B06819 TaxID=3081769 RepID=UPI00298C2AF0|nr:glycerol-3-phosphate acyltransferase [Sporosarcina sp. YIM B06819]